MAENPTDLWGRDIALDTANAGLGRAVVTAGGELALTDGEATGVQDIKCRIFTRLGTLFYDRNFGSLVHDWILEENTAENRMALEAELVNRIERDSRVIVGSVAATTLAWDESKIIVQATWAFIGADQPYNLVLQYNKSTKELVTNDVAPTAASLNMGI